MVRSDPNPFRYGREADILVDRIDELHRVVRIAESCGTLFPIGPRRLWQDLDLEGDFQLAELARRHSIPRTTIQRAVQVLEAQHFLRRDFARTGATWRLEDPLMRAWLTKLQAQ